MKLFAALIALNLAATASAFGVAPRVIPSPASSSQLSSSIQGKGYVADSFSKDYDIIQTLGNLEGPSICYGHFAVLDNKRELDIKEYDNFDAFKNAIDQAGLTNLLRGKGPFTVLAPTNTAIEKYTGVLSEEVLKYHILVGDIYSDELDGKHETLNGEYVTARSEFRKLYLDDAMIGQKDNHTYGTPYPTDHICENGIIHAINVVLKPGWKIAAKDSQGVQGLSLQSHLKQDVLKERGALPEDAKSKH